MKGKNTFTTVQVQAIKKLIEEKIVATPTKQKIIRQKIRNIGFYYSDFDSKKIGYTITDFEALIYSKHIIISDENCTNTISTIININKLSSIQSKVFIEKKSSELKSNLDIFKINRFDPKIDFETTIVNSSGNYIICLKRNSKLPSVSINPILTNFEGFQVIYTGISKYSLRTRDFKQHFKGNNAGRSTLRKSLGALFGYKHIPRDKNPNTGKTKFGKVDEDELSEWMCENLIMFFLPTLDFDSIEIELIKLFNPPLNLKSNKSIINSDFRQLLSRLRNS